MHQLEHLQDFVAQERLHAKSKLPTRKYFSANPGTENEGRY
jgi:hypothetical protein